MIKWDTETWSTVRKGYAGKQATDIILKKCLDSYCGDIATKYYLPQYSTREDPQDYTDRLERAKHSYFNFPEKIITIYSNAIFRTSEPIRETANSLLQRFMNNCDGAGMNTAQFIKDRIFLLNQIGGCLIVVDKPKSNFTGNISRYMQDVAGLYSYAYPVRWEYLRNYGLDEYQRLKWILLDNGKIGEKYTYKLWDRTDWAVIDQDQLVLESGAHNLGIVPVIRSFGGRNPKYDFNVPRSPIWEVVKIALRIFELMSQLDQAIIYHIFLKIVMPKSMYDELKKSGLGQTNTLVVPDQVENKAYYIETPSMEIDTLVSLIFDKLPHMILELATIKDKTDRPREESGVAKVADSVDEIALLSEKASVMEQNETEMIKLAGMWEGIRNPGEQFTVEYSKDFDIKSVSEKLTEMVTFFKEIDGAAPTFAKEMLKRVMRKALGNIDMRTWSDIERDLENSFDPSLSLTDIDMLIERGMFDIIKYTRVINPALRDASDEIVVNFIKQNVQLLRGASVEGKVPVNDGVD